MFMDEDDKLLDVAVREADYLYNHGLFDASLVIRELLKQRNNMLEVLKAIKENAGRPETVRLLSCAAITKAEAAE